MKNLIPIIAIIGLVLVSSCSTIEENNDPIIGIWVNAEKSQEAAKDDTIRNEWIFNDAYLGRYHQYNNEEIVVISDFRWSSEDDIYTITYPGLEDRSDDKVALNNGQLIYVDGKVLAERE